MSWFASPYSSMLLGCMALVLGSFELLDASVGPAIFWLGLGAIGLASGWVREVELRRGRRYGGVLGALGWLTAPLFGKYRDTRPPR
jgi:hypothetical protein